MAAHFEKLPAERLRAGHLGLRAAASVLALAAGTMAAQGQEIVLDRPVHAGELTLFPSVRDNGEYYYAADRAELAVDEQGRPQFSFLQYVDSLAGSGDESEGGGVVHALVELSVDEDLVSDAQRALTQVDGDGIIVGPVNFRSGTFALISSFAQADGSFTDAVMGVGKAPLLQNERAAVSLRLTREGAEVLRGSLESPTPDLSFSFEMEMDGYRSPKEAVLEADFERVYSHDTFAAGVATPYLQAEIEAAFEDLRREGAIRLTQIGDDENLDQLVQAAYTKLTEIMFERAPTTGTDALAQLQGSAGGTNTSLLDRAANLLSAGRQEARQSNEEVAQRNSEQATQNAAAAEAATQAAELRRQHAEAQNRAENARRLQREAERRLAAEEQAQRTLTDLSAEDQAALAARIEAARRAVETNRTAADEAEQAATAMTPQVEQASTQAEQAQGNVRELESPQAMPSLAVVASYKMKRSKMSGSFRINLNKYTAASQTLRFDRNLGDLRRNLDDVIQVVDVGDTAFRRREVGVILDGVNAEDFGDFVNSVTVLLEKEHEDGSATQRELAVNRQNFDAEGADFALAYNRLGDEPAADFLTYRYEVLWNFFGGIEVAEPARLRRTSDITLSPPMSRRAIQIEADPDIVDDEGIRAITIRLVYNPGDRERIEQVVLRPRRDGTGLSETIDIVLPDARTDYAYEMEWIMRDGSRRVSGRIPSDQSLIFADLMPGG